MSVTPCAPHPRGRAWARAAELTSSVISRSLGTCSGPLYLSGEMGRLDDRVTLQSWGRTIASPGDCPIIAVAGRPQPIALTVVRKGVFPRRQRGAVDVWGSWGGGGAWLAESRGEGWGPHVWHPGPQRPS